MRRTRRRFEWQGALEASKLGRLAVSTILFTLAAALGFDRIAAQAGADSSLSAEAPIPVRANINITPKRLTFDPGERTATVYIFNQGTAPASFDITLVDRVMLPNGEIEAVSGAADQPQLASLLGRLNSAKNLLIATPRRATIAPGKGQMVRVRIKGPPPGGSEYRSHLTVTTIPPRDFGVTVDEAATAAAGDRLSFQVASVFGISIPVIIRSGLPDVQGRVSGIQLSYRNTPTSEGTRRIPVLSFELERTGANSLYGNIEVRGSSSRTPYAVARGVGVYPEIASRLIQIPLQRQPAANERLEVKFIDDDITPGRVIAEGSLLVG